MPPKKRNMPKAPSQAGPSSIYSEMLAEATSESDLTSREERPLKRQKATPRTNRAAEIAQVNKSTTATPATATPTAAAGELVQPVIDLDATSQSAASVRNDDSASDDDLEFETVNIDGVSEDDLDEDIDDLQVSVASESKQGKKATTPRQSHRQEKAIRILAHKAHLVALLAHVMVVNSRCNDKRVQESLAPMVTPKIKSHFRLREGQTEFQQNHTFKHGMNALCDVFRDRYEINAASMHRAFWQEKVTSKLPDNVDIMTRQDFVDAARTMSGSADVGNQLFCAMLRKAGVKTRLVCSLQVLPLAGTVKPNTPQKVVKPVVFAIAPDRPLDDNRQVGTPLNGTDPAAIRRRLGQPPRMSSPAPARPRPVAAKKVSIPKLDKPIFWVEVFDKAYQKWVPVDPLVTRTVFEARRLEPSGADMKNQLTYVIAFNRDGSAKDVTRRYTKTYNSKIRRTRIEIVGKKEATWYESLMNMFAPRSSDANAIEDGELEQRVAQERMPSNIQDFKDHPVYALQRHLKRHEALAAKHQVVGRVNAGTAAKPAMEPVYRRSDVHPAYTAEQWYRHHGRELLYGEQAVKWVKSRADKESEVALYTISQTEVYIPPPVHRGNVPTNKFGNIDIYVPSMVPEGGAHIRHPLAMEAAAILRKHAVEAVTGFKFSKGAKGTKIVDGVVVAAKYADAVKAVIEGLEWQQVEEQNQARSLVALRMWKRLVKALGIIERVSQYGTETTIATTAQDAEPILAVSDVDAPLLTAGQYTVDELVELAKAPKKKPSRRRRDSDEESDGEDGSYPQSSQSSSDAQHPADQLFGDDGGFVPDLDDRESAGGFLVDGNDDDQGGGFLPESPTHSIGGTTASHADHSGAVDVGGGGFLLDDEESSAQAQPTSTLNESTARTTVSTAEDVISIQSQDPEDDGESLNWMDSD